MEIPKLAFDDIAYELLMTPLRNNIDRKTAGKGMSQTFGVVTRRHSPAEYSRNCWFRPYLYKMLLEFGNKYVPFEFNAITVNQNYQASSHRDKNNVGVSFLVAFGNYTGGELVLEEGERKGEYDICRKPIIEDFSTVYHSVKSFVGDRFSLVYYKYVDKRYPMPNLPPPSVRQVEGEWTFFRGEEVVLRKEGLPHILKGRKREKKKIT